MQRHQDAEQCPLSKVAYTEQCPSCTQLGPEICVSLEQCEYNICENQLKGIPTIDPNVAKTIGHEEPLQLIG